MKVLKKALSLSLPLCIMTAVPTQEKWAFENGQYPYYDRTGQLVTDDFAQSGAYVYYFDENGNPLYVKRLLFNQYKTAGNIQAIQPLP